MNTYPRRSMSPLTVVLALSGVFFAILLLISGTLYFMKSSGGESKPARTIFRSGSVAVVEVNGVIMDSKKLLKKIEKFEEDSDVKAMVVRINSPGGAVAPSQEVYEAFKRSKKPVVASMGSVAASGGYYVACAAKKVFANPGTITGSIGVIMEFMNLEKLYEWAKVRRFSIKTGKYKDSGAEYREMTADDRALLQGMVDDVLSQFKQAVAEGRKLPLATVSALADGRVFSGQQAKQNKLVDELGTIQDAINEAGKLGGIKGKPRVTYGETSSRRKWLEMILDDSKEEGTESEARSPGLLSALLSRVAGGADPLRAVESSLSMAPGIYWLWTGAR